MNRQVHTVIFMVLITMVFITGLSLMNGFSIKRIQMNTELQNSKSILYAFGLLPREMDKKSLANTTITNELPWDEKIILVTIGKHIQKIYLPVTDREKALLKGSYLVVEDSVEIHIRTASSGEPVAYGFPLKGKGLWGTISAFGVISSNLTRMVGIDFTEQVETPGLGARITEEEFKCYFRSLDLTGFQSVDPSKKAVRMVRKKHVRNWDRSTNELQAITGATQTCNGVLNMMNIDLLFYITLIQNKREFIDQSIK